MLDGWTSEATFAETDRRKTFPPDNPWIPNESCAEDASLRDGDPIVKQIYIDANSISLDNN